MATKKPVKNNNDFGELKHIYMDDIQENDENPRSEIGSVDDLKASIKEHGLLQPIVVRRIEGNGFKVVAGSRRFKACKELGLGAVACYVIDADDTTAYELATAENIVRENMTAVDEANAVAKLFAQGKSRTEIGAMFGKSARWAEGRRRIVELGDKAMKMLAAGKINLGHAEVLTMCRKEDVEKYLSYATWKSPEDLKTYIMNEKPLLERAPFNAKKVCKNCENRSDCQRDLFGDVQNSYCLDRECFEKNVKKTVETVRKQLTSNGYTEVPEDDYSAAMYGWSGYCQVDDEDEDNQKTIEELKEKGAKPMFWIDKNTAEYGIVYKEEYGTDSDDDDTDDDNYESCKDSWEYQLNQKPYEIRSKIRELASQEEKAIIADKLKAVFGQMRSDTKAFILSILDRCIVDENGEDKSYLEDFTRASVDFLDEVASAITEGYNGTDDDIRKYLEMDSREEFERRAAEQVEEESETEESEDDDE